MKPRILMILGVIIMFFTFSFTTSQSTELRWTVIGHNTVDFRNEKGQIYHRMEDAQFTSIRLGFQGDNVDMHHCVIHYTNGEKQTVPLKKKFKTGSMSKIIDFKGGKRAITKVEYFYTPSHLAKKKTIIELWTKIDTGE